MPSDSPIPVLVKRLPHGHGLDLDDLGVVADQALEELAVFDRVQDRLGEVVDVASPPVRAERDDLDAVRTADQAPVSHDDAAVGSSLPVAVFTALQRSAVPRHEAPQLIGRWRVGQAGRDDRAHATARRTGAVMSSAVKPSQR